jgi:hypothetical protein
VAVSSAAFVRAPGQAGKLVAKRRDPGSAGPFWALIALTGIVLLAPQSYVPALAPFRIALLTAAFAIGAHLFDRFVRREPFVTFTPELRITAALVGWVVLTTPFSMWPGGSLAFLLDFYLKTLAIFWLLGNTVDTLTRLQQVAWALSVLAVPLAATGIANFVSGAFMEGASRIVGYEAPLTANPNDLALMLNLILPLTAALLRISTMPSVRALLLLMIALDVVAVIATFSRAGFLMLTMTAGLSIRKLLRRQEQGWAIAAMLLLLVCVPLLPSGYVDRLATIANIEADPTGSAQARWNDTLAAVRLVLTDPLVGAGVGMNVVALNDVRGPTWKAVHNAYLQYAVELGVPGLVLFVLLLVRSIRSAASVERRPAFTPAQRTLGHLAGGIRMGLVVFAVGALFGPVGYHVYFYYMAGLAVAASAIARTESVHPTP